MKKGKRGQCGNVPQSAAEDQRPKQSGAGKAMIVATLGIRFREPKNHRDDGNQQPCWMLDRQVDAVRNGHNACPKGPRDCQRNNLRMPPSKDGSGQEQSDGQAGNEVVHGVTGGGGGGGGGGRNGMVNAVWVGGVDTHPMEPRPTTKATADTRQVERFILAPLRAPEERRRLFYQNVLSQSILRKEKLRSHDAP
jgi:hypothetical protein